MGTNWLASLMSSHESALKIIRVPFHAIPILAIDHCVEMLTRADQRRGRQMAWLPQRAMWRSHARYCAAALIRSVYLSMRRSVSRDSEPQSENRVMTLLLGKKTTYLIDEKDRVIPSANIPPSSVRHRSRRAERSRDAQFYGAG